MSDRQAFEAALRANPDDLAGWCAYADYLVEQDDPRGEFMQVQIALEDANRSKEERDELKARESALLESHRLEWLGELAPFADMFSKDDTTMQARFTRGWFTELTCNSLTVNEARALARSPQANLLTRLLMDDTEAEAPVGASAPYISSYYEPGPDVPLGVSEYESPSIHALMHVPALGGVRVFRFGDGADSPDGGGGVGSCRAFGDRVHEVVARMPLLEELYLYAHNVRSAVLFAQPMPRLRVLYIDHVTEYPLDVLAANPTLGNLTHLLCHPHALNPNDTDPYITLDHLRSICTSSHLTNLQSLQLRLTTFGDVGVEVIIGSGVLKRLKVLDLQHGCITDEGAKRLAARRELRNLDRLDLSSNALTEEGIAALAATGVTLFADQQHSEHPDRAGEYGYLEYLTNGDWE